MPTVAEFLVQIGVDAQRFTQGMRQASDSTREMQKIMKAADKAIEADFIRLGQTMAQFGNDTESVITKAVALGAAQKKIADQMINDNVRLRGEVLQSIGTVMNATTSMQRVTENVNRVGEGIHALSPPFLALGRHLENVAKKGNVALVALREIGPQASTKQLIDQIRLINQGIARMQAVALVAGIATIGMFTALVKLSNAVDGRLIPAGQQFKSVWLDALKPLATAVTEFLLVIIRAGTAVGRFMQELKETSPILAGMIQGFVALIPLVTLFLAPLAIGISTLGGFRVAFTVAFNAVRVFVTGLLTVIGPAILVTAVIVGIIGFLVKLTKESEAFRNAVSNAWNAVKQAAQAAFAPIMPLLNQLKQAFMDMVATFVGSKSNATGIWQAIGQAVATFVNNFANVAMPLLKAAFQIASGVIQVGIKILIAAFTLISAFWQKHGPLIKALVTEVFQTIGVIISTAGKIISAVFTLIMNLIRPIFPLLIQLGMAFVNGIGQVISALSGGETKVQDFSKLLQTIFNFIGKTVMPILIQAFKQLGQDIQTVLRIVIPTVQQSFNIITNVIKLFSAFLKGDTTAAWQATKEIFRSAVLIIRNLIQQLFGVDIVAIVVKFTTFLGQKWVELKNTATTRFNELKASAVNIWNAIVNFFTVTVPNKLQILLKFFQQMPNKIMNFLSTLPDRISFLIGFMVGRMTKLVLDGTTKTIQFFRDMPPKIVAFVTNMKNTVVQRYNELKQKAIAAALALAIGTAQKASQMVTNVINFIKTLPSKVMAHINNLRNQSNQRWNEIKSRAISLATNMVNSVVNFIRTLPSKVSSAISRIPSIVNSIFSSAKSKAVSMARNLVNGAVGVIRGLPNQFNSILNRILSFIDGVKNRIFSKAKSMAKNFWNGFKKGLGISSPSLVERAFFAMADAASQTVKRLQSSRGKFARIAKAFARPITMGTPMGANPMAQFKPISSTRPFAGGLMREPNVEQQAGSTPIQFNQTITTAVRRSDIQIATERAIRKAAQTFNLTP